MDVMADVDGFYYEGTVYTDAEEEEMIRKQFNIPKSA
jgi:3-deoxy-D-manno-octulosonate 8-phosphate phosphatase KdsC-like HAD superfamily phosphatase